MSNPFLIIFVMYNKLIINVLYFNTSLHGRCLYKIINFLFHDAEIHCCKRNIFKILIPDILQQNGERETIRVKNKI